MADPSGMLPDPTGRFDLRLRRADGTWTERVIVDGQERVDPWDVASANPRPVPPWPAGSRYCVWCTRGAIPGEAACTRCSRPLFDVPSDGGSPAEGHALARAGRPSRVGRRGRIGAAVAGVALCVVALAVVLLEGRDPKKPAPPAAATSAVAGRADGATAGGVTEGGGRAGPTRRTPVPKGTPPGGGANAARQACSAYQAAVKEAMAGTPIAPEANPRMHEAVATLHKSASEAAKLNAAYEPLAVLAGLVIAGEPEGPAILKECNRLGF